MMNIDCEKYLEDCLEYQELDDEKRQQVNQHLNECESCREEFLLMKELDAMYDKIDLEIPDNFGDTVIDTIKSENKSSTVPNWLITGLFSTLMIEIFLIFILNTGIASIYGHISTYCLNFYHERLSGLFSLNLDGLRFPHVNTTMLLSFQIPPIVYGYTCICILSIIIIYQVSTTSRVK